ncbi:MAG: TIGR00159 family protein [Bacteroidia bacterium]|nr:TIGR00159 family protein [Bacteroidia bacterium]
MTDLFINVRILDILDIVLVAFLMYQIYFLIKGTVAINIFLGIFAVYLIWLIVKAMNLQLLSSILGQFIGVGVIALIIVFQQEIRRFLLMLGTKYFVDNKRNPLTWIFSFGIQKKSGEYVNELIEACSKLAQTRTGALIVVSKYSELLSFAHTGDIIEANISNRLIESIFNKFSPLHDGAIIITGNKIKAARCVLPLSDSTTIAPNLGLRHRSALGMSQMTEAGVIVVSEETGDISFAKSGVLKTKISYEELKKILEDVF